MTASHLLCEFFREYMRLKRLTYADCERITGASWMTFRRLANGDVTKLRPHTQDALCALFGVDITVLQRIVEEGGDVLETLREHASSLKKPAEDIRYDVVEMSALWQWLSLSVMRVDILRAQGYRGVLPAWRREPKPIIPTCKAPQQDTTNPKEPQ